MVIKQWLDYQCSTCNTSQISTYAIHQIWNSSCATPIQNNPKDDPFCRRILWFSVLFKRIRRKESELYLDWICEWININNGIWYTRWKYSNVIKAGGKFGAKEWMEIFYIIDNCSPNMIIFPFNNHAIITPKNTIFGLVYGAILISLSNDGIAIQLQFCFGNKSKYVL